MSCVVQTQMSAVGMIGSGVAVAVSAIGTLFLICHMILIVIVFLLQQGTLLYSLAKKSYGPGGH